MRSTIEASMRAGETVTRTAERILDVDRATVDIPKYVEELSDAARQARLTGDHREYVKAVEKWRGQIERLGQGANLERGQYTLRSASRQLIEDLRTARAENIDRIVDRWVLERARYQARVMARHEAVEAYRDMAIEHARTAPYAQGMRWALSSAHPRPDICDVHASSDQYGLGAGGYPSDAIPVRHPSCLCTLSPIVDVDHFKRSIARIEGTPEPPKPWLSGKQETPEEWLKSQPEGTRLAIIGPTRAKALERGAKVLDKGAGAFRPVHEITQTRKPTKEPRPRVKAAPIVARDRATMVQPFPALPKTRR